MEEFGLKFPVWTIGTTFHRPDGSEAYSVIRVNDADCGPCMPVFSDLDIADRFIEQAKVERSGEYQTIIVEDPKTLGEVVNCISHKGCEYIVVDCSIQSEGPPSVFISVEQVLEACDQYD